MVVIGGRELVGAFAAGAAPKFRARAAPAGADRVVGAAGDPACAGGIGADAAGCGGLLGGDGLGGGLGEAGEALGVGEGLADVVEGPAGVGGEEGDVVDDRVGRSARFSGGGVGGAGAAGGAEGGGSEVAVGVVGGAGEGVGGGVGEAAGEVGEEGGVAGETAHSLSVPF